MIRKLLVAGMAAFAFSAVATGAAQAAPFSLTFNHGFASIGCAPPDCTLDDEKILEPPDSATISGDNTAGALNFPAGDILQRDFMVTIPGDPPAEVTVTLTLTAVDPMTGTYDNSTGQIDISATHVKARAQVPGITDCTIDPVVLAFTTEANSYHNGVRYNHLNSEGPGALATNWTDLPPPVATSLLSDPLGLCPMLDDFVDGPGGVWLSKDLSTIGNPLGVSSLTSNPASPNESNSILIKGTGAADPGNVHVFLNNDCSGGSVAQGSSSAFNGAGIGPVNVPEDETTQISVRVHDLADRQSPCSAGTPYSYTDPAPAPPPPPGGGSGGGGGGAVTPAAGGTAGATAPAAKKCKKTQKLKKGRCVKKKKKK